MNPGRKRWPKNKLTRNWCLKGPLIEEGLNPEFGEEQNSETHGETILERGVLDPQAKAIHHALDADWI